MIGAPRHHGRAAGNLRGGWTGDVVDADLHAVVGSADVLRPHLAPQWIEWIDETGFRAPPWQGALYPPGAETTVDPVWREPGGEPPGTTLAGTQRQVLDALAPSAAILHCSWGIETIRHPDFAAGLASAVNDWLIAEWLERDPRLRASLVVPAFVPEEAAREIDRVGGHPGFVGVFLPSRSTRLYGQRPWQPMFDAIVRNDLVACLHYGGTPDAPGPAGAESWFMEDYVAAHVTAFQAQLASLVIEGLFQRCPGLRVAFLESGFSWLGPLLWRLDREWPGLRREVPWLNRAPSAIVREHIRFSVQPIDAGPPEAFRRAVEWLGSDELLMFSTDHPHGHERDVSVLLEALPPSAHRLVMADNARTHFRL
ncbi:amidohydrolase [Baekduia soli]|uniref:Amidohydrolase n=1 Tax=Baekduia soli TaxID=496014 RepID=A0A5B8U1S9_9ACTN|nr:amidohydrolase family protein [Baekduia soli]QEC46973.1 amidohydrolase [Baekduia soli]